MRQNTYDENDVQFFARLFHDPQTCAHIRKSKRSAKSDGTLLSPAYKQQALTHVRSPSTGRVTKPERYLRHHLQVGLVHSRSGHSALLKRTILHATGKSCFINPGSLMLGTTTCSRNHSQLKRLHLSVQRHRQESAP